MLKTRTTKGDKIISIKRFWQVYIILISPTLYLPILQTTEEFRQTIPNQ